MAYNVWFVIWPNQKKALGIVECLLRKKLKSAKTAMLFSRTNTIAFFSNVTFNGSCSKSY